MKTQHDIVDSIVKQAYLNKIIKAPRSEGSVMYEQFTDRARKIMQLANQEAQRCNQEFIGILHLFVAMIREGQGVAGHVLLNHCGLNKAREECAKISLHGKEERTPGKLPMTPGSRCVVDWAIEEARKLNHNHVGSEHLLLGWLRLPKESDAGKLLQALGVDAETLRVEVLGLLANGFHETVVKPDDEKTDALLAAMRKANDQPGGMFAVGCPGSKLEGASVKDMDNPGDDKVAEMVAAVRDHRFAMARVQEAEQIVEHARTQHLKAVEFREEARRRVDDALKNLYTV